MNVTPSQIEIQELHAYTPVFNRAGFDADRLMSFLNDRFQNDKKWSVDESEDQPQRVVIQDVRFVPDSVLLVEKAAISEDSILLIASCPGRELTEADEVERPLAEVDICRDWLREFFELAEERFTERRYQFKQLYLTKCHGVRLDCNFESFMHPELRRFFADQLQPAYSERGFDTLLHPFAVRVKVNASPLPQALKGLSVGQVRALYTREDWELNIQNYPDYDDQLVSYETQLPFHLHVKTLRQLADLAARLKTTAP